ncbi:MAG TPA: ATP-binding protein, partial [Anaerolineae bacterium]|nr:ATP-binding protein [Anaerolineae bacterium]
IPPEEQARLFLRFQRGSASEILNVPGTGLGLSISAEIMKLHHGHITVESAVGKGSVFTVWLPVTP